MQLQIFSQYQQPIVNSTSWEQAKKINEIAELTEKIDKLKEQARYLYGNKRGAWGRMTQADEKRSNTIDNLQFKLRNLKHNYKSKYKEDI